MMLLAGSRVLITGGAGFVGSHIADRLVKEDVAEIIIIDNLTRGSLDNLQWVTRHGNIRVVKGDIRDASLLNVLCCNIDFISHQAAIRITQCVQQPREAFEILMEGTFNILEAAAKHKVKKVIAASSASIYGTADAFPTKETHHPYNSHTMYAAGKVAGELMLQSFYDMYSLDCISLRYFNVYGPRMDIFGVYTEVMIRWLDLIDQGEPPVIFGDGSQTLDFTYIDDVVEANILAMKSDITNETFNIAGGVEVSLQELAASLLKLKGSSLQPVYRSVRKANTVYRRLASTTKAERLLHFKAQISLLEGLQALMAWRKEAISSKGGCCE